jgi:pimeloyl-ACP methyl ester carboxylesterase
MAGTKDRVVKDSQAIRLHEEIPHSVLRLVPGAGHMVHYAVPDEVARAIEEVGKSATMFRRTGRASASYTASAA